ncbi:MAG TPA: DUF4388 domain-containing protein [Myxococcales bacterium]|nr:DUF4388 domain-containing protein [Myxococcales bacterium]
MSFAGSLNDVPVSDLLQFIRIGGRTGTLTLISGLEHAEISFIKGAITSASGPGSLRLGELLLVAGVIELPQLDAALELQAKQQPRRTLGRILVDQGLPLEAMHTAVRRQIEEVVRHVVGFRHGSFEFAPEEIKEIPELPDPGGSLQLDTQSVLLEALQLLDEERRGRPTDEPPPPEVPAPLLSRPSRARVQLVTRDDSFAEELSDRLAADAIPLARVPLHEAGTAAPGDGPPMVLLDLRAGAVPHEALQALRRTRPRAWLLAVIEDRDHPSDALRAGAMAAMSPDADLWAVWTRNWLQGRDVTPPSDSRRRDIARLRRVFEDLRSGLVSTGISLSLMNVVADSAERCVLFLPRSDALVALGAFGAGPAGRSLAQVAAGFRLDVAVRNAFTACLESRQPLVGKLEDGTLPTSFFERIGKPRTGQFAVIPVVGGQKVVALVYVDNGVSERPLDDLDVLELASAQAGLAFENELLRREVRRS